MRIKLKEARDLIGFLVAHHAQLEKVAAEMGNETMMLNYLAVKCLAQNVQRCIDEIITASKPGENG